MRRLQEPRRDRTRRGWRRSARHLLPCGARLRGVKAPHLRRRRFRDDPAPIVAAQGRRLSARSRRCGRRGARRGRRARCSGCWRAFRGRRGRRSCGATCRESGDDEGRNRVFERGDHGAHFQNETGAGHGVPSCVRCACARCGQRAALVSRLRAPRFGGLATTRNRFPCSTCLRPPLLRARWTTKRCASQERLLVGRACGAPSVARVWDESAHGAIQTPMSPECRP